MRYTLNRYGAMPRKDWGGALTGASSGYKMGSSIGMMFGPIGGLIGTGIGTIAGALFGNRAENKREREQAKQDAIIAKLKADEKIKSDLLQKRQTKSNDYNALASLNLNDQNSLFMKRGGTIHINPANKGKFNALKKKTGKSTEELTHSKNPLTKKRAIFAQNAKKWKHSDGGTILQNNKIISNGRMLTGGNKLLTKNGSTIGSHESGANIPIKRNNKTIAIAEPGEVLVNDKDISNVPFVLSKRLGFAQEFMKLEGIKNMHNANIIEDEQSKLVSMNNRMVSKGKYASGGISLMPKRNPYSNSMYGNTSIGSPKYSTSKFGQKEYSTSKLGETMFNNNVKSSKGNGTGLLSKFKFQGLDANTIFGAAGTIGNLLMSNKTLKRQKGLIQNSLDEALSYTPKLNKNYLLNENVNVNDQVSAVNQGFASTTSGLEGIDPAIASALKNSASGMRNRSLSSIYTNRNNIQTGIRNQNTMNIMNNNNSNNSLLNETSLMKLNAKIAANEQFGNAEAARLENTQGAISEFNTILRDKDIMKSLDARWKNSIGTDYTGKNMACGGRVGKKRKRTMAH